MVKNIALEDQNDSLDIEFYIKGKEIKKFIEEMLKAWTLMGKKEFFRTENELKNVKFQRSVYVTKKITQLVHKYT